jgi:conjugative relaxase-like TrwC/TraI family protein
VISIRRVSLGGGFRYLMASVARGDGDPGKRRDMAAYYVASGTPPGRFLGAGLADLDSGRGVADGSEVAEAHLARMLGALCDPVSGEPVGSAPVRRPGAPPVAGFDLTFSPPKSVSVAWALADEETRAAILECHQRAVEVVLTYAEAHVFGSRSGRNGVLEEDVSGVVGAAFTHWASRAGDPQLHDHVVVWNRARSVSDDRWRTIDSRRLFKSVTMLSDLHQGVLSDLLTAELGVGWEARERRHADRPRYEIAGVPESLMAEFSQRASQIADRSAALSTTFRADYGRSPTTIEAIRLSHVATVMTRPAKEPRSLAELVDAWRARAGDHVGVDQRAWVANIAGRNALPLLRAGDLEERILLDAGRAVLATVAERRATFEHQHVLAAAHRLLHGVRFATPTARIEVARAVAGHALGAAVVLTPGASGDVPEWEEPRRRSPRLAADRAIRYTTVTVLQAEARLLEAGRDSGGPGVPAVSVETLTEQALPGRDHALSSDQAEAVGKVACSGRMLDVLVGPAGSGKSTAMAGLRALWEETHGSGSIIGLAPSAAAAQVLAEELGIPTENTAKWLTEWRRVPDYVAKRDRLAVSLAAQPHARPAAAVGRRHALAALEREISTRCLGAGQLVIVDEASLAGTLALDELVGAARAAGAKVVLVGDPAQLGAVEAGGGFSMLVADRDDAVAELGAVQRFEASWERQASIALRRGDPAAIDAYDAHGRICGGERTAMLDAPLRRLEGRSRRRTLDADDCRRPGCGGRAQRPGPGRAGGRRCCPGRRRSWGGRAGRRGRRRDPHPAQPPGPGCRRRTREERRPLGSDR